MAGRRPIFASLFVDFYTSLRDLLYLVVLEPASPEKRNAKKKESKKDS